MSMSSAVPPPAPPCGAAAGCGDAGPGAAADAGAACAASAAAGAAAVAGDVAAPLTPPCCPKTLCIHETAVDPSASVTPCASEPLALVRRHGIAEMESQPVTQSVDEDKLEGFWEVPMKRVMPQLRTMQDWQASPHAYEVCSVPDGSCFLRRKAAPASAATAREPAPAVARPTHCRRQRRCCLQPPQPARHHCARLQALRWKPWRPLKRGASC